MCITIYLLHVSVFVTQSSGRPLRYLLKNYVFFAMLLHMLCYRMRSIPCCLKFAVFKIICSSFFCILRIYNVSLKSLLQHINICWFLLFIIYVGNMCMLTLCSCVWIHSGVQFLRGPCSCCCVFHLCRCAGYCSCCCVFHLCRCAG